MSTTAFTSADGPAFVVKLECTRCLNWGVLSAAHGTSLDETETPCPACNGRGYTSVIAHVSPAFLRLLVGEGLAALGGEIARRWRELL